MASFIDALRSGKIVKPSHVPRVVYAFDPDLRTVGWACVYANADREPMSYRAGIIQAIDLKLTGLEQVRSMVEAISRWSHPLDTLIPSSSEDEVETIVLIEAQEFYAPSKFRPRLDANTLIRLAQVTGALQARLTELFRTPPETYLPKTWKGQKQKDGMHNRVLDWLTSAQGMNRMDLTASLGKNAQHALDALCMAKWRICT